MNRERLMAILEALLATSSEPVTTTAVLDALEEADLQESDVASAFSDLVQLRSTPESGLRIEKVADGWRMTTVPDVEPYLRAFHATAARQRLSQAALEVLAIVAYRQPVTAPEVNFIRGVNSGSAVRTLLERKLIRVAGRKAVVGKPFLYRTTSRFLIHFGLQDLNDLPDPEELDLSLDADGIPSDIAE